MASNPTLIFKWLKSENASSKETKKIAKMTREHFGLTAKQYRKMLSKGRALTKVLETLMSANKWEDIDFSKIPSRAGFIYRNAFARRDIIKMKYEKFMNDDKTTVNAKDLYPYEIVSQIMNHRWTTSSLDHKTWQKYWDNLSKTIAEMNLNALAVVDTSGSMYGTPLEVAISLGLMCAEKNVGPYHNHFFTFSDKPKLQAVVGEDIYVKVHNLANADWNGTTNIEACFDLMLDAAVKNHLTQSQIPSTLLVISDMEFDSCVGCNSSYSKKYGWYGSYYDHSSFNKETLFETLEKRWAAAGYALPNLVFWNVSARNDRIPMKVDGHVTYVSGFSPSLFQQITTGKTGWDLVLEKLLSDRYKAVC